MSGRRGGRGRAGRGGTGGGRGGGGRGQPLTPAGPTGGDVPPVFGSDTSFPALGSSSAASGSARSVPDVSPTAIEYWRGYYQSFRPT